MKPIDKEVFAFWKDISPEGAFGAGLKEYAGTTWIPTHANKKNALARIKKLEKKTKDKKIHKFLNAIKRGLMIEEVHDPPGGILGVFYTHLVVEGIKEKHILSLAEQSLNALGVQEYLLDKTWPIEMQIYSAQNCDGATMLLEEIKRNSKKKETKDALTAVQKRLAKWKEQSCSVTLKDNDFAEIYPLMKQKSKGLGRKKNYRTIIKDFYDYIETPEQIEKKALGWINEELPTFTAIKKRLAKRYSCKPTVESIQNALGKAQHVPLKQLVSTIKKLRGALQPLAEKEWVKITSTYDVRVIETPPYLVPFLPTAAMQPFNTLTKPFCIFFATTDKKASPSSSLPELAQTLIHEEYGHCVNFMNSFSPMVHKPRIIEILGSSLDTPITEGLSFYRELESLRTLQRMSDRGAHNNVEKKLMKEIEKHVPFEEFVEGITFVVYQWRMVRFLRALSDVRLNLEKQTFPQFIAWAHKKTGLSKKLIFDQTFHFQEHPGYAPCYSIFGQKLRELQAKARKKGINEREFNTFVASIGFPARSIFEKELKQRFKI